MTPDDEKELFRLCELLGTIDKTLETSSPLREGLEKGALAIQAIFWRGHRIWVESAYNNLHDPNAELTPEMRAAFVRAGIDPDA